MLVPPPCRIKGLHGAAVELLRAQGEREAEALVEGVGVGAVEHQLPEQDVEHEGVVEQGFVEVAGRLFGKTIRPPLKYFMKNKSLDLASSERRPDFRSSAQKRLMPQLQLKVPVFRRWGKKFFVVVDDLFFNSLPSFNRTTSANSEITWLSYPFKKNGPNYKIGSPEVIYSEWEEVQNALREGLPPDPEEIFHELQTKLNKKKKKPRIIKI